MGGNLFQERAGASGKRKVTDESSKLGIIERKAE